MCWIAVGNKWCCKSPHRNMRYHFILEVTPSLSPTGWSNTIFPVIVVFIHKLIQQKDNPNGKNYNKGRGEEVQGQLYCTSHFVTTECGNYASDWKQLTELFNPAEFQWHISNRYAHCSCTWSAGASVARIEKVAWCTAFQGQPVQGTCKDWQDAHAGKRLGSSASRTHALLVLRVSRMRVYFSRPCLSLRAF